MELSQDDYCDECWLIVSSENQDITPNEAERTLSTKPPEVDEAERTLSTKPPDTSDNAERTLSTKPPDTGDEAERKLSTKAPDTSDNAERTLSTKPPETGDEAERTLSTKPPDTSDEAKRTISSKPPNTTNEAGRRFTSKSSDTNGPVKSKFSLNTVVENQDSKTLNAKKSISKRSTGAIDGGLVKRTIVKSVVENSAPTHNTRIGQVFGDDMKSLITLGASSMKSPKSNWSTAPTILTSESQFLHGARPSDSDLCLDCLIKEHSNSFENNLLKNVYGSVEEVHECRMIPVQKRNHGKYMWVCSDSDCPRFRFWKVVDSAGAGWKVDTYFEGCFPPPRDVGGSSCFTTSDSLCSKEQLVDLSQVGLSPRIMDEVRPEIEVSEWFCGRGDSTSRYGFKVSLLDSRQLMTNVYGECRTLEQPEAPRWRKVVYTFRDYEPGVRYVLFHHGGQGQAIQGRAAEGESHPGSKMAGASVLAKLPRSSNLGNYEY